MQRPLERDGQPYRPQTIEIFRPIRRPPAFEPVVDIIVDAIRGGMLSPGDRIPEERALAARLEVSRETVRRALAVLVEANVVSIRRGRGGGAFVQTSYVPAEVLTQVNIMGPVELRALFEVRRTLALQSVVLACERASTVDVAQLREFIASLGELVSVPEVFIDRDFMFHLRIARASRNDILVTQLQNIFRRYSLLRESYPVGHIDPYSALDSHAQVVDAIEIHDANAAFSLMDEYLKTVEMHFLGEALSVWGLPIREPVISKPPQEFESDE